jgi:hypothetical protein
MTEQARYQVRFDWSCGGAHAVGSDADVVVWVDAIASPATDPADPTARTAPGELPGAGAVIDASLSSAAAAARWILALQEELRERLTIAVVAAGEARRGPPGEGDQVRFAVEDFLAAGAVIEHLADLGLDATSPEAAAAAAAYVGLRPGIGHLVAACVTAATTAPDAAAGRVDPELGPDSVVVRRDHPRRLR